MLASSLCASIWQALRCLASFLPVCRVCRRHFLWRADLERLQGLQLCFYFHSSQSVPQFPQRNTWFNIHTFVIFQMFSCYWFLISFHYAWRIYFRLSHFRFITLWLPNAFYSKPFLFHFSDFIWEVLILLQALKMLLVMHVICVARKCTEYHLKCSQTLLPQKSISFYFGSSGSSCVWTPTLHWNYQWWCFSQNFWLKIPCEKVFKLKIMKETEAYSLQSLKVNDPKSAIPLVESVR